MTEKSRKVNESQIDFLKPCPFCGGKAEIVHPYRGATGAYIFCTNCCLSINHGFCRDDEALKELTDMWNARVRV